MLEFLFSWFMGPKCKLCNSRVDVVWGPGLCTLHLTEAYDAERNAQLKQPLLLCHYCKEGQTRSKFINLQGIKEVDVGPLCGPCQYRYCAMWIRLVGWSRMIMTEHPNMFELVAQYARARLEIEGAPNPKTKELSAVAKRAAVRLAKHNDGRLEAQRGAEKA